MNFKRDTGFLHQPEQKKYCSLERLQKRIFLKSNLPVRAPDYEVSRGLSLTMPPTMTLLNCDNPGTGNITRYLNCGASGDPIKETRKKGIVIKETLVNAIVESLQKLDASGWDYRSPELRQY